MTQNGSDVIITWSTTDSGAASVISDSSFYSSLQSYLLQIPGFNTMLGSTSTYTYRLTISDQTVFTVAQYEDALRLAFANAAGIDVGSVAVTITQNGSDVIITRSTTDSGAASVISDSSFYSSLQSHLLQIPGFNTMLGSTSTHTYRLTIFDQTVSNVAQYEDALLLAFANAAGI